MKLRKPLELGEAQVLIRGEKAMSTVCDATLGCNSANARNDIDGAPNRLSPELTRLEQERVTENGKTVTNGPMAELGKAAEMILGMKFLAVSCDLSSARTSICFSVEDIDEVTISDAAS